MIVPDRKDWTWVLERPCPECGFEATKFPAPQVGEEARANAQIWRELLTSPSAATRTRPDRWSVLEYACHVRDVFRICSYRLDRMLTEDGPQYDNWDQDVTAIEDRYDQQDPATIGAEVVEAATVIAARFETVEGDDWRRTGYRSDGAEFTIETFAQYVIHDPMHHLWDVRADAAASAMPTA